MCGGLPLVGGAVTAHLGVLNGVGDGVQDLGVLLGEGKSEMNKYLLATRSHLVKGQQKNVKLV